MISSVISLYFVLFGTYWTCYIISLTARLPMSILYVYEWHETMCTEDFFSVLIEKTVLMIIKDKREKEKKVLLNRR